MLEPLKPYMSTDENSHHCNHKEEGGGGGMTFLLHFVCILLTCADE